MWFRVIHHESDKDLLLEMVKSNADELKNHENKNDYNKGKWEKAFDSVIDGHFSKSELAIDVLSIVIHNYVSPAADDHCIPGYDNLADKTSGMLAETLQMFVHGRNYSTGKLRFGEQATCGYLTPDEVT